MVPKTAYDVFQATESELDLVFPNGTDVATHKDEEAVNPDGSSLRKPDA
jgi:hypothetical protein